MATVLSTRDNEAAAVDTAAAIIRAGGVVAYPTETFYGLGADAFDPEAVARVFHLKRRPRHKPLSILISSLSQLESVAASVPSSAQALIERFWPGPLTIVLPAAPGLPPILTANTGSIGVRMSSHHLAQALVDKVGGPITTTSANLSNYPSPNSAAEVIHQLGAELDAVLDGGLTPGGIGSTIADVTSRPPKILRLGAIAAQEILSCWQQGVHDVP